MSDKPDKTAPPGFSISFDLADSVAEDFILKKTIRLRDAYGLCYEQKESATIEEKIKTQILQGFLAGHPVRTVAVHIMDELLGLVEMTVEQAIIIAATELIGAANYSRYLSINNSGFTKKQWFTAKDERVRPLHQELHNRTVNIGDLWVFSDGHTLRYPGDYLGPDHLVVGCRCTEIIVVGTHRLQLGT